jgi:pilus assembly protein CpaC
MRFGETLMLGGLILQRQTETRTKIPFLGDLPWVGSAFARRRSEVGETELLIMVTPQIAAPIVAGQLPVAGPGANSEPSESHEFYYHGFMEVPAYNPPPVSVNGAFDAGLIPPTGFDSPAGPTGLELPPMTPPSMPAAETPPAADDPSAASAADGNVTQTSGVFQPRRRDRATTIGSLPATRNTTVRSNAGDDLRPGSTTGGHSSPNSAAQPNGRRLQLIEPPSR